MIVASRKSLLEKRFDITEEEARAKLKGDELQAVLDLLPTEAEREWMKVFTHRAPEKEREQRKMSVCLEMEVSEMRDDFVAGEFCGTKIEISCPKNPFKVSRELEKSKHDAFTELCRQQCVVIDGAPLNPDRTTHGVDVLNLCVKVADRFFFQTYL